MSGSRIRFADRIELEEHYNDHGADFGASDAFEYQNMAEEFLCGDKEVGILQCTRTGGDMIRFCLKTSRFGVISQSGIIRTFFMPLRCVDKPVHSTKRCHDYASDEDYYRASCSERRR